jgi:hypothetical protein
MLCGIFAPEIVYATGSQIVLIAFALISESVAKTLDNCCSLVWRTRVRRNNVEK